MLGWIFLIVAGIVFAYFRTASYRKSLYWNWDDGDDTTETSRKRIAVDKISFPEGFLWGTATAAHQVEGGHNNNNWALWEHEKQPNGLPTIRRGQRCGLAANHWKLFREDIDNMVELGCNSYRLSLSWSKLCPNRPDEVKGQLGKLHLDRAVVEHYHEVLETLRAHDIVPMVTLHHFTNPVWFDKIGGWERKENCRYFQQFAEQMFIEFGTKVPLWCTINEPVVLASGGWVLGKFPPGKQDQKLAGQVLFNLLHAHCLAYNAIKKIAKDDGTEADIRVGIVKNIFQFDAYHPLNPLDHIAAQRVDELFNGCFLRFFQVGLYQFPDRPDLDQEYRIAPMCNDFIGLNYYSHYLVQAVASPASGWFRLRNPDGGVMTDMTYTVYPEGIYRAIVRISALRKPIYITENGISDKYDDRRHFWIQRYLYAVSKAIADGMDVRGYYYWSLMDNFEWAEGFDQKFGLYHVDFKSQRRTLRNGAKIFRYIARSHQKKPLHPEDVFPDTAPAKSHPFVEPSGQLIVPNDPLAKPNLVKTIQRPPAKTPSMRGRGRGRGRGGGRGRGRGRGEGRGRGRGRGGF